MAAFAVYFSFYGTNGLTQNKHFESYPTHEAAIFGALRNQKSFARDNFDLIMGKGPIKAVDYYVMTGGKRVSFDNPTRYREIMRLVEADIETA